MSRIYKTLRKKALRAGSHKVVKVVYGKYSKTCWYDQETGEFHVYEPGREFVI